MHTLTVVGVRRRATVPGPSRGVLVALVSLALVGAVAPVARPALTLPAGDHPSDGTSLSGSWTPPVLVPHHCRPRLAQLPPAAALDAALACHDITLAARARALEFNPVR